MNWYAQLLAPDLWRAHPILVGHCMVLGLSPSLGLIIGSIAGYSTG